MLGIDIGVNTREVEKAIKQMQEARGALDHLGDPVDLAAAVGLKEASVLAIRLKEDIARLRGTAFAGDRQGGQLSKNQFKEAATVSKQISANMKELSAHTEKVNDHIKKLKAQLKDLDDQERRTTDRTKLSSIAEQRERLRSSLKERQKEYKGLEKQGDLFYGQYDEYNQQVQGNQLQKQPWMSGAGKRAVAMGAAVIGAGSLVGVVTEAMSRSARLAQGRTGMSMLGGGIYGNASQYGFNSLESLGMAQTVAERGGFGGQAGKDAHLLSLRMSRAFNMGGESSAGFVGMTASMTGMNQQQLKQYIEAMRDLGKLGKHNIGTRIAEYVQVNQRLLQSVSTTSGGASIDDSSASFMAGLQAALWSKGPAGTSGNILSKINSGIAGGGGSPSQQLFMWSALGGNDIAKGDLGSLWDFESKMQKGIGDSENVRGVLNKATSFGDLNSPYVKMILKSQFGMTNAETDAFVSSLSDSGALGALGDSDKFKSIYEKSKASGSLESDAALGTSLQAQTQAGIDDLYVGLGDAILEYVTPLKQGMVDAIKQLNEGRFTDALETFGNALLADPLGNYSERSLSRRASDALFGSIATGWSNRADYAKESFVKNMDGTMEGPNQPPAKVLPDDVNYMQMLFDEIRSLVGIMQTQQSGQ